MRQEIARAHKGWALDAVMLDNEVTKMNKEEVTNPPPEGLINHSNRILFLSSYHLGLMIEMECKF